MSSVISHQSTSVIYMCIGINAQNLYIYIGINAQNIKKRGPIVLGDKGYRSSFEAKNGLDRPSRTFFCMGVPKGLL